MEEKKTEAPATPAPAEKPEEKKTEQPAAPAAPAPAKADDPPKEEKSAEPKADDPPPKAAAVKDGKTERELELERKLKLAETLAAEKEDQLTQLKKLPKEGPKKKGSKWTFFHDDED